MEKASKIECYNQGDFTQRFRVVWKRGNSEFRYYGPWSDEYSYLKSFVFRLADIGLLSGDEAWIQINPTFGSAKEAEWHVTCELECTTVARYNLIGSMRNYNIDMRTYDEIFDATVWTARCALKNKDKQVFDVAIEGIDDVKYTPVYVSYMVDQEYSHYLFFCSSVRTNDKPEEFYTVILVLEPLLGDKAPYVESIKRIPAL